MYAVRRSQKPRDGVEQWVVRMVEAGAEEDRHSDETRLTMLVGSLVGGWLVGWRCEVCFSKEVCE